MFPWLRYSLSVVAVVLVLAGIAQQNDVPLQRDIYTGIERNGADTASRMHTGLRPIITSRAELHDVIGHRPDSGRYYYWITEKLFKEHLVEVREGEFRLTIDPVFRLEMGREFNEHTPYSDANWFNVNSRGLWITADIGPTVSFQTTFYENQAVLSGYLYHHAQTSGSIPGQGRIKGFGHRGLDFAWAMGNVSWSPKPWLNAQLGNGRHFVGNGYRSTLLSDNTTPYPYIKFSAITTNKRLQYSVIHAKFNMVRERDRLPTGDAGESIFYWKRATMHHLSVSVGKRLQLALFEATLWRNIGADGVLPYDPMELNPLIGVNSLVNGFKGPNQQLVGLDAKWRIGGRKLLYGQFAVNDPDRQRYAWQLGGRWFDVAGVKDLNLLLEYDHAMPFTYTGDDARMNYTHGGQALAQPLGAAFNELVVIVDHTWQRKVHFKLAMSVAELRSDTAATGSGGGDLFVSGSSMEDPGAWRAVRRNWCDVSVARLLNPMTNLSVMMGYRWRDLVPAPQHLNSGYLYIGISTGLFNSYYDL